MRLLSLLSLLLVPAVTLLAFGETAAAAPSAFELLRLPPDEPGAPLVKWKAQDGTLALGRPARVTWAVATRTHDLRLPYGECSGLRPLDELLAHHRLARADFLRELEAGFALWEKAAGVKFTRIADEDAADVLVGMSEEEDFTHGRVSLALDESRLHEKPALAPLRKALICYDRDEHWVLGPRHELTDERTGVSVRLLSAHEAGHALGLNHAEDKSQLMHHGVNAPTLGLGAGDLEGIRALYGPVTN